MRRVGHHTRELYRVNQGESIRFSHELNRLVLIEKPGIYTLRTYTSGRAEDAGKFEVGLDQTVSERKLDGGFLGPPDLGPQDGALASCRVSVGDVRHARGTARFLIVDRLVIWEKPRDDLPRSATPLPAGADVEKAEMDYLGQVWVVARAGYKSTLILWNMRDLTFRVLVPWGEHRVELGTTPAWSHVLKQNVVIAGLPGQAKFTTTSVNAPPGSTTVEPPPAPAAPTTRGAESRPAK